MTLLESVTAALRRSQSVTLERPGRAGRTLSQRRNRRASTAQATMNAYRDARWCELSEDDRRFWVNYMTIVK